MNEPPDEPRKVVPMHVRDEDRANAVGVEMQAVEADQHGGAAVDQKAATRPIDLIAGLQPATGAKGIAATDHCQLHGSLPAPAASPGALRPGRSASLKLHHTT